MWNSLSDPPPEGRIPGLAGWALMDTHKMLKECNLAISNIACAVAIPCHLLLHDRVKAFTWGGGQPCLDLGFPQCHGHQLHAYPPHHLSDLLPLYAPSFLAQSQHIQPGTLILTDPSHPPSDSHRFSVWLSILTSCVECAQHHAT